MNHVHRLGAGKSNLDASLVYLDMLSTIERISSYISRLCRYEKGIPAPLE